MLNLYLDRPRIDEVDARLMIGMASKLPVDDREIMPSNLVRKAPVVVVTEVEQSPPASKKLP